VNDEITRLLPALEGHFVFESGHHGTRWLELERLCYSPRPIRELATELAKRLSKYPVDMVCGPLVEGAFVALFVAEALGVPFTYTERQVTTAAGLYPVEYRLPGTLRDAVRGKTVAIVNDVINAGSAVRSTFADLQTCEAKPIAIGCLAVLGQWTIRFAEDHAIALETLAAFPTQLWTPAACPLCAEGIPLTNHGEKIRD